MLSVRGEEKSRSRHSEERSLSQAPSGDESDWVSDDDACDCRHCLAGESDKCAWADPRKVVFDTVDRHPETERIALAYEELEPPTERDSAVNFQFFAQREGSKIFKQQWHEAVTDPEERAQYEQLQTLLAQPNTSDLTIENRHLCLNVLLWQRLHFHARPKVWNDMELAFATMSIFFKPADYLSALSEPAAETMAHLADNKQRAGHPPQRRTFVSNLLWPQTLNDQASEVYRSLRCKKSSYHCDWDKVVQPRIAHWFRAGVVAPAHLPHTSGQAIALTEPERGPDVYFNYRKIKDIWPPVPMRHRKEPWLTLATSIYEPRLASTPKTDQLHASPSYVSGATPPFGHSY